MSQTPRSNNSNDSFDFVEIYHPAAKMAPGSVKATESWFTEQIPTQTIQASATASDLDVTPPTRATAVESLTQPNHIDLLPVPTASNASGNSGHVSDNGKLTGTDQKLPAEMLRYAAEARRSDTVSGDVMLDRLVIGEKGSADADTRNDARSDMREMWHSPAVAHKAPVTSIANPKPVTSMAETVPPVECSAAAAFRQPLAFRPWLTNGVDNHTYYPDNAFPPTYHYRASGFYDSPVCASPDLTVYPPDDVEDIDHFHAFVMSREPTPPPVQTGLSQGFRKPKPKQSANQILREYRQQQASYRCLKEYGEKIEREEKEKAEMKAALHKAQQEIIKLCSQISMQENAHTDSKATINHLLAEVDKFRSEAVTAATGGSAAIQRNVSEDVIGTFRRRYYQTKAIDALKAIRQDIRGIIRDLDDLKPLSNKELGESIADIDGIANRAFDVSEMLHPAQEKEEE